jgi:hypothetical protein
LSEAEPAEAGCGQQHKLLLYNTLCRMMARALNNLGSPKPVPSAYEIHSVGDCK